MKHKRPHINQRDQWATGADLGRPSATQVADRRCRYPGLRVHNPPSTIPNTQKSRRRRTYNCGVKQPLHCLDDHAQTRPQKRRGPSNTDEYRCNGLKKRGQFGMFRRKKQALLTLIASFAMVGVLQLAFNGESYVTQDRISKREISAQTRISAEIKSFIKKHIPEIPGAVTTNTTLTTANDYDDQSDDDDDIPRKEVPLPYEAIQDQYFKIKHRQAMLHGRFRAYKSFLTIGIPTVKRKGTSYLDKTLTSLNKSTQAAEKKEVVIVVFFTDKDHEWIIQEAHNIYNKYRNEVDSGFIQLVHPHHNAYPNFTRLERTFNDSAERVAWRSKQNLDYSYLFTYCQNISHYYMQIEDDVLVTPTYFKDIRRYITNRGSHWFVLSFSKLGFIGKCFKSKDLSILADFLLMFFAEKPGDILLNDLRMIKGQRKEITYRPSMFQHIGIISSLKNKKQLLFEKTFRGQSFERKKFYNDNPEASLDTNMEAFEGHTAENAYNISETYFWAVSPPSGSYYRVIFHSAHNVSRLYISSGIRTKPLDRIKNATINVSVTKKGEKSPCKNLTKIGEMTSSVFDTSDTNTTLPYNVDCISIDLSEDHRNWVIISEIAIFLEKT
ncbi:hypothetical protein FSP39_010204 [Pinctada imbricata]|uniref:Alpha-1,3-mannosyl-glycoprotein 4-beta-N-acetylglucosaminyltransferase C n=1 Tax=Pinctada imbricata TaxID=66713 RepID=A0AA89C5X9_PINIB|nr:hypothetical protein FSP39_010204 [Pinctada imbricata]